MRRARAEVPERRRGLVAGHASPPFQGRLAAAEQAVKLRLKQLESSADHHHKVIAPTDALTALKILAETHWAE